MNTLQHDDPTAAERVARLHRRVAWQVEAAYGTPEPVATAVPVLTFEAAAPPTSVAVRVPEPTTLPTLHELERLVADGAATNADRVEEWRWYLFYLRDFAYADGSLPDSFGMLIETAFAPLL